MADVAPSRSKRARSPSPGYVDTLASPLEVLLKRRRRSEWASATGFSGSTSSIGNDGTNSTNPTTAGPSRMFAPPPPPVWQSTNDNTTNNGEAHHDADNSSQAAASSPLRRHAPDYEDDGQAAFARRAVERRRTRQWERLQDPSANSSISAPNSASQSSASALCAHHHSYSHQHLPLHQQDAASRSLHSSPAERHAHPRRGYSTAATPERPGVNNMSSSPIRHNPPSSTPFRDDDWTEDERIREWGDEYSSQNSVLYSLHRARVEAIHASVPESADNPLVTPDPQRTAPPQSTTRTHVTPYGQALPTPYRHHQQRTPLDTPGLVSSDYASSPLVGPFSPMDGPAGPAPSPAHLTHVPAHEAAAVRAGYEEANRLLAALNVARMRRHETHEEHHGSPLRTRDERGEAGMAMDEQW